MWDGNRINTSDMKSEAYTALEDRLTKILAESYAKRPDPMAETWGKFYNEYKGIKVRVSKSMKADFGDNWKDVSRSGRIKVSETEGVALNTVFSDMLSRFPELFDKVKGNYNLDNEADQIRAFISLMKTAKTEMGHELTISELPKEQADEIYTSVANAIKEVEQIVGTEIVKILSPLVDQVSTGVAETPEYKSSLHTVKASKTGETSYSETIEDKESGEITVRRFTRPQVEDEETGDITLGDWELASET